MSNGHAKLGMSRTRFQEKRGADVWQWKMDPVKMYFLLKMGMFHCYVSLPEGKWFFLVLPLISGLYWWSNCTLTIDRFSSKWMPCSQMPWLIRGWLYVINRPSCWFGMMIEYWLLKFTMFIIFIYLLEWTSCDCTDVRKVWLFNLDRHRRCLLGLWLSIFGDDLERPPFKFQVDYIQDSRRLWINRDLFSPSLFETTCRWLCKGHALNLHISNWYWFKLTKKAIK